MSAVAGDRCLSMRGVAFWRAYATTCRPYLCFVSAASGLVGLALAPAMPRWAFVAGLAAFFGSYGFGQALTDVSQTDTDALSSPYRPLVQGRVSKRQVLEVSLAGLAACALVLLLGNPWTLLLSGLGTLGLATYTPCKRRWWAGPAWNAWIVACLPVIGAQFGSSGFAGPFRIPGIGLAVASVFFSYATFVLLGYLKDISADRATGYDTLPVRFGWRATVLVSGVSALLASAASLGLLVELDAVRTPGAFGRAAALVLWASGIAFAVGAHRGMWRRSSEDEAHGPIALCVRGYLLLHLGEAVMAQGSLVPLAVVLLALFELALAARPEERQV